MANFEHVRSLKIVSQLQRGSGLLQQDRLQSFGYQTPPKHFGFEV